MHDWGGAHGYCIIWKNTCNLLFDSLFNLQNTVDASTLDIKYSPTFENTSDNMYL